MEKEKERGETEGDCWFDMIDTKYRDASLTRTVSDKQQTVPK